MSDQPITTTYRDIVITYWEGDNKWRFTANGRERSSESLVKAKESIDRALDEVKAEKVKPWQPFEAYLGDRYSTSGKYQKVKVTSVAEDRGYGEGKMWVSNNGNRSKESISSLYAVTPENDALISEIQRLTKEREALEEKLREAKGKMVNIEVPKG